MFFDSGNIRHHLSAGRIQRHRLERKFHSGLLAAVVLAVLANDQLIDKQNHSVSFAVGRSDPPVIFLLYFYSIPQNIAFEIKGIGDHVPATVNGTIKSIGMVIVGLAGLVIGGEWIVNGAVHMALKTGIEPIHGWVDGGSSGDISAGTGYLGHGRLSQKMLIFAIGNVVGSNIFNIFFCPWYKLYYPFPCHLAFQTTIDLGMVILAKPHCCSFSCLPEKKRSLDRWEGMVSICLYVSYIIFLLLV